MLTLPIKRKWFDMICRGEKREEYREATEYYRTRINSAIVADPNCKGQAYKIFPVKIRAGYNSKAPAAILRVHCIFGKGGVREWGADPDKYYYILQILRIESIENWKGGNIPAERLRCETCLYWEDFNGVCFCGESPYCADFTDGDDGCCYWQQKEPITQSPADTEGIE